MEIEELRAILSERFTVSRLDERSYSFTYLAGSIPFNCYAEINPDACTFVLRAISTVSIPKELRPRFMEYCTRINYSLPIGNFALNLESGDFRWKSGVYWQKSPLTEGMVRDVLESSFYFIKYHALSFVALFNEKSLAEALQRVGEDPGVGSADFCKGSNDGFPPQA